jgi:hypothetical protein
MLFIKAEKVPGGRAGGKNGLEKKSFRQSTTDRPADGGVAGAWKCLPPRQGLSLVKIAGSRQSMTWEVMASRLEPMASPREAMTSRLEPMASLRESMASRLKAMTSPREPMASHLEAMTSRRQAMASRVESAGSAGHFWADYAELLGFCDKVKFDPWPEPPTGEVFEANQDWSDRQQLPPWQCRKSDWGALLAASKQSEDGRIPHLNGSFPVFILGWRLGQLAFASRGAAGRQ